jgi:hypothetical protein
MPVHIAHIYVWHISIKILDFFIELLRMIRRLSLLEINMLRRGFEASKLIIMAILTIALQNNNWYYCS